MTQEVDAEQSGTCAERGQSLGRVAVLFARADSNYKAIPGVDVWDEARDARNWPGGCPVVAHPPCRAWGILRQFAKPVDGEKELALFAVWPTVGLPEPGQRDKFNGWTLVIHQHWFGHRAEKATRLYIVGCEPSEIPELPLKLGEATHCIRPTKSYPRLPSVTKAEREHTPPDLAEWLIELASRCTPPPHQLER